MKDSLPSIALIDDDYDFLETTAAYLRAQGFRVDFTPSPFLAERLIKNFQPDILILDYDMPEMSGMKLLERIRLSSAFENLPVLFLTAYGSEDLLIRGYNSGLDDFLHKPLSSVELALRLKALGKRLPSMKEPTLPTANTPLIYILYMVNLESLSQTNHSATESALALLESCTHRLRDRLGAVDKISLKDSKLLAPNKFSRLIYLNNPLEERSPGRVKLLEHIPRAAERLMGNVMPEANFLGPARNGELEQHSRPFLRLLEIKMKPGQTPGIEELLRHLSLELERENGPRFQSFTY